MFQLHLGCVDGLSRSYCMANVSQEAELLWQHRRAGALQSPRPHSSCYRSQIPSKVSIYVSFYRFSHLYVPFVAMGMGGLHVCGMHVAWPWGLAPMNKTLSNLEVSSQCNY